MPIRTGKDQIVIITSEDVGRQFRQVVEYRRQQDGRTTQTSLADTLLRDFLKRRDVRAEIREATAAGITGERATRQSEPDLSVNEGGEPDGDESAE